MGLRCASSHCQQHEESVSFREREREREENSKQMEDVKKRKIEEASGNGEEISTYSEDHLRSLLDPLAKPQLVDLLAKLHLVSMEKLRKGLSSMTKQVGNHAAMVLLLTSIWSQLSMRSEHLAS